MLISVRENDIFIYTPDGDLTSSYTGGLNGISPSGTKILIATDTWLDLSNGKRVDFGWDKYRSEMRGPIIWSANETRVFRCCYVYGDAATGKSYELPGNEIVIDEERRRGYLNATLGGWIGNSYVLPQPGWADTDPIVSIGFIPIFDPSSQTFHKLTDFFGLPAEFNTQYVYISISPNGDYLWLTHATSQTGYLVNLKTREVELRTNVSWSAHGKFMFVDSQVITLSNNELRTLPKHPELSQKYSITTVWHPIKEIYASVYADERKKQTLFLFDTETFLYKMFDLPSEFRETYSGATKIIWSPNGDRMALSTTDGSLWELDYPGLQNLEQLTPSMPTVKDILWSPDGAYLSFVSGKDIYIVDTKHNP